MAEYIIMPKLGFDMREGVLVSWLKDIGDEVNKGDVVAEIESDKATLELESQVSGVLLKKLEEEGAVVPIGANLAVVGEEGEEAPDEGPAADEPAAPAAEEEAPAPTEEAAAPAAAAAPTDGRQPSPSTGDEFPGGVKASPVARRIAQEQGVDLSEVTGSGPNGRIRKSDVEAYLEQRQAAPAAPVAAAAPAAPAVTPTAVQPGPDDTVQPTTRLRQAIARRMLESKVTIPHFYVTSDIDMGPVLALRKQINALLSDEQKVTVNDLIVKGAALALRDFPNLNASFAGEQLIVHNRINVGSAVAVEGGLLTVVQKDTDRSTLSQIAADHKAMIERARSGKMQPDDIQGSTFTVSNLGAFDVEDFVAIINPPEAAILAVGTAKQVPVVEDGEIKIGTRMKATISADHRVTDGAEAARFMQRFKEIMEEPMRLLL